MLNQQNLLPKSTHVLNEWSNSIFYIEFAKGQWEFVFVFIAEGGSRFECYEIENQCHLRISGRSIQMKIDGLFGLLLLLFAEIDVQCSSMRLAFYGVVASFYRWHAHTIHTTHKKMPSIQIHEWHSLIGLYFDASKRQRSWNNFINYRRRQINQNPIVHFTVYSSQCVLLLYSLSLSLSFFHSLVPFSCWFLACLPFEFWWEPIYFEWENLNGFECSADSTNNNNKYEWCVNLYWCGTLFPARSLVFSHKIRGCALNWLRYKGSCDGYFSKATKASLFIVLRQTNYNQTYFIDYIWWWVFTVLSATLRFLQSRMSPML